MELVILIGLQASGKSTFARSTFSNYEYVSKDAMRNARNKDRKQEVLIRESLEQGISVIVDNTNPSVVDRAKLISLGREYGSLIIGYYFESKLKQCLERNRQRDGANCVPDVALYSTAGKLEIPAFAEGFDQLYYVRPGLEAGDFVVEGWQEDQDNENESS
jgi:predicted kinase